MSSIEWTDKTWNPTKGCSKVTAGCTNCYAIRMAYRLKALEHPAYQDLTRRSGKKIQWTGKVSLDHKALVQPLTWKKPARVFVNSMSDMFYEDIPQEFLEEVWKVMEKTPHLQYQILTKRAEYMQLVLQDRERFKILPNVWLGVSVENADHVERLDLLRQTPATIKFVSFEPLLGSVHNADLNGIDWAIVGGESGPGSRLMEDEWVTEIEESCRQTGTAFFFKQWGGTNKKKTGRLWKGKSWDEYPAIAA